MFLVKNVILKIKLYNKCLNNVYYTAILHLNNINYML
nr:MAG TPA: hypothetical protein [Caudoviricetes sp.]